MKMQMIFCSLLFLFSLTVAGLYSFSALAVEGDSVQKEEDPTEFAARRAWEAFRTCLRTGQLQNAYLCFSPRSRQAMPYAEFLSRYSPISAATQVFLRNPVRTECTHRGDKAILKHIVHLSDQDRQEIVLRVFLAREEGVWKLAIEKVWPATVLEADAREVLSMVFQRLKKKQTDLLPRSFIEFRMEEQDLIAQPTFQRVEQSYSFRLYYQGTGKFHVKITPHQPGNGLHAFEVDSDGRVQNLSLVLSSDPVGTP